MILFIVLGAFGVVLHKRKQAKIISTTEDNISDQKSITEPEVISTTDQKSTTEPEVISTTNQKSTTES